MKHKVATLTGALLDAAVAKAEGKLYGFWAMRSAPVEEMCFVEAPEARQDKRPDWYCPSTMWQQGGPIIERERIELFPDARGDWVASHSLVSNNIRGETPLIAAMRAYVHAKFGDSVEL